MAIRALRLTRRAERMLRLDTRHHVGTPTVVDALSAAIGPGRAVLLTRDSRGEWRAEAPRLERVRIVREVRP